MLMMQTLMGLVSSGLEVGYDTSSLQSCANEYSRQDSLLRNGSSQTP